MRYVIFLLYWTYSSIGQNNLDEKIENYYKYYKTEVGLVTNWLREREVVPILLEEFERGGFEWLKEYALYKLDSNKYISVSVINCIKGYQLKA